MAKKGKGKRGWNVPILPVAGLAGWLGSSAIRGNDHYGNAGPLGLVAAKNYLGALGAFADNLVKPDTLGVMAIPLGASVILRVIKVNPKIGKHASIA